jgi:CBS domain-containing protein
MTTIQQVATADEAWKKSCFSGMDFTINDEETVYDAVQKLAGFNIGCLVTVDNDGNMTGVVSERDYVCKIALLGRTSKETMVKQISTKVPNLVTAKPTDSVEDCMARMLTKGTCAMNSLCSISFTPCAQPFFILLDIRHLPLVSEEGKVMGMISIKDLVKTLVQEKEQTIKVLSDFALGKGGVLGSE